MTDKKIPRQVLRIVDANLNRVSEGLRVLEEAARFILNDAPLSESLKTLRHQLSVRDIRTSLRYLDSRDSQNDVGVEIKVSLQDKKRDLAETVIANARRVEEALRVMEEISKVKSVALDSQTFQDARFKLYTIEKELVGRLMRRDLSARVYGLYAVVDSDCLKGRNIIEVASQVLAGGVKLIQLRDKISGKMALLDLALALKKLCAENDALLIINDHLDITLASDADGLHVGQEDLPVSSARALLPIDKLIGCSVTTVREAQKAKEDGADYLACGAVYATPTKPDCPVVGLEALGEIKKAVGLPLVAIGGINIDNLPKVFAAGADAAAVISAVVLARSPERAAREMLERIEACHEQTD
ncbi:MAG: thiamine phosphate synthase [Dehalococcoidia bacterium]|nr:MAG: thiamine phosphate synthase [Dehalococcoidia bacterium]